MANKKLREQDASHATLSTQGEAHNQVVSIRNNARRRYAVLWLMSVISLVISIQLIFDSANRSTVSISVMNVFPWLFSIITVTLIVAALRATRQWKQFASIHLVLQHSPIIVGGEFDAYIDLPQREECMQRIRLSLSCSRIRHYVAARNRSRNRVEVLFHDQQTVQPHVAANHCRVHVKFKLDSTLPASGGAHDNDYYEWKLHIASLTKPNTLNLDFTLPVLASPHLTNADKVNINNTPQHTTIKAGSAAAMRDAPATLSALATVYNRSQLLVMDFFALRKPAYFVVLIAGVLLLISSVRSFGGLDSGSVMWIVSVVFALSGLITCAVAIYQLLDQLRLEVDEESIHVRHTLLAWSFQRNIAKSQIAAIDKIAGYQSNTASGRRVLYRVVVFTQDQRMVTLAAGLPDASSAEWIIGRVGEIWGIDVNSLREHDAAQRRIARQRQWQNVALVVLSVIILISLLLWQI